MKEQTKPIAESNNFIILDKYTREWVALETYQSENDLESELVSDLVNQGYDFRGPLIKLCLSITHLFHFTPFFIQINRMSSFSSFLQNP